MSFGATILDSMKVLLILSSKWVNGCQGDGFLSMGVQTDCHSEFAVAGYSGLVVPIFSIVGLLILHIVKTC